jgi:choline dehydrogenase
MVAPLVVVGAGSAGAVIAARVTEDPDREVLLIEAGPDYIEDLPNDLRDGRRNSTEKHDWGYFFLPNQSHDPNPLPRGKVVGGSSAVNTCIALRGQPYDYDEWAELGGKHWAWRECEPYFRRLERDLDFDNEHHGSDGPLPIRRHRDDELVPIQAAFLEACAERDHPRCVDHNDPTTTGAGAHAMNKVDGVRISVKMAYLDPVRARGNLRVMANTLVRRVLFSGRKVCGVEVERGGRIERIEAERVVLSGGAIATPGLLLRSGIGPRDSLERLGIDTLVDAPVGERLLDHPGSVILLRPKGEVASGEHPLIQTTMRYASLDQRLPNDMQLQPVSFIDLPMVPLLFSFTVVVGKPSGHGRLWHDSAATDAKPRIESRLGEHPRDRERILEGLRIGVDVAKAPAMRAIAEVIWPNDALLERSADEWLLPGIGSGYHPCGTVPMGADDDGAAVLDFHGRVRGVEGLFVADASIMPTIPSSNINLPTIMIGERFGEWLREGAI